MERNLLKTGLRRVPSSLLFQAGATLALLMPLVATWGQFADSGFVLEKTPVLLLFWPGTDWKWAPHVSVWVAMGLMSGSYLIGMTYLLRHRTLGKVLMWGIAALVVANLLSVAINHVGGWTRVPSVSGTSLTGRANRAIFSLWHNPVWEEVVFRGLPLLLLLSLRKKDGHKLAWPELAFIAGPSCLFALYHLSGQGPSRVVDTFVLGCGLSWMALRFTFFAPLVVHCILDAAFVVSMGKLPGVPVGEVQWLANNSAWINSGWSVAMLVMLGSVPVMIAWNALRRGKPSEGAARGRPRIQTPKAPPPARVP